MEKNENINGILYNFNTIRNKIKRPDHLEVSDIFIRGLRYERTKRFEGAPIMIGDRQRIHVYNVFLYHFFQIWKNLTI